MAESQAVLNIFNLSLSHVGHKAVALPGESPECQLHFPDVRDTALSWAPWTFAKTVKTLVQISDGQGNAIAALDHFLFLYAIPGTPHVLRTLDIDLQGFRYQKRLWLPPGDPEHPQEVVATDAHAVVLTYIGRVSEGLWSPFFTAMVGMWLAVAISNKLARRPSLRQELRAELTEMRTRAIDIDGHQDSSPRVILNNTYIRARETSGLPFMQDIAEPVFFP